MLGYSDHESEEEGCYVFWETKSILAGTASAPAQPGTSSPRPRVSQRSGAPSPSLGVTSNGTPKPKRTTTVASLPSPSGSTSGATTRPARLQKRRKALDRRKGGSDSSSQPLDARTLQMVSQLAMKVNARAAGLSSPVVPRQPVKAGEGVEALASPREKGKEREVAKREPLLPSTSTNALSGTTSPLRRTPARASRSVQGALGMSASKPVATKSSPRRATKPLPPVAIQPQPPAVIPVPHTQPPAVVPVPHDSLTNDADDEESFFDDLDDTFELALSQLDETAVAPTPPSSLGAASRKPNAPKLAPLPAPQTASSHLAPPRPVPRPAPLPRNPSRSSASSSKIVLRTSRTFTRTMSAEAHRQMEELAKRELEAIADSIGADGSGWSDEDF
ncbi:proteophosphoglycan 5 [Rhodotorula toruloides]|uniref:Proteophosphoglycan 5 n=1 Tax=Rhodotorula toruloides TaxID=5286 RepID=A0A511KKF6_RHOTO|nr:proteophosphoglycan 5 [Rhodotorula toruloides]